MSKSKHDAQILAGIPRGNWADQWATEQEEKGRSFSGQELTSIAPKTPAWAKEWAKRVADEIVKLNDGLSLANLYDRALGVGYKHDKDQFGLELGMQVAGHGVSWEDNIPWNGEVPIKIRLPHMEFYG